MESQRLSLLLSTLLLSIVCAAQTAADEPALLSLDSPPLLLETGAPAIKNEPVDRLPIGMEEQPTTVERAFDFKGKRTEPLPSPRLIASDIGELLSPVGNATSTDEAPSPVPSTAFRTQLAQLERAASEASNLHSLGRLAAAAEALATRPALSDTVRLQAMRMASWAYAARGRRFDNKGNRQAALRDFDRAVRLMPESTTARLDRAISLAEQGESERALQDFDQVIRLAPEWLIARRNRAALLFVSGEDERALTDCDVALRLLSGKTEQDKNLGEWLTLRGRILHRLGHPTEAIADFDRALLSLPSDPTLHWLRGNVFAEVGFYEQAINDYLTAVHADPAMAQAYRSLAWVLATCPEKRLRNSTTAIEAARRAQQLGKPGDPMTLDAVAAAHASAGNFNEAIRLQQRALVAASPQSAPQSVPQFRERLQLYRSGHSYVSPVAALLETAAHRAVVTPATHESAGRSPSVHRPAVAR